jgi:hypothetical protein
LTPTFSIPDFVSTLALILISSSSDANMGRLPEM